MKEASTAAIEEYERQIFDLRQLLEISKSLNSTLDYPILIDSILFTILGQMKVLKAGLFAKKNLDSPSFSLHRNHQGFDLRRDVEYSIPEDHPLVAHFTRAYGCLTLDEIRRTLGSLNGLEGLAALEPSLVIPLKAKGVINGILVIGERIEGSEFSATEREYVINIANLAAIAISNAFLFEMTTTDMMTKLKMKHYFYTVLSERMDRFRTERRPLSVLMLDIDHFKRFNDTYGHSCGDLVLKQTAVVLQESVRPGDLAARYGGEEFCLLLPETDGPHAALIAERIRKSVEANRITYEGRVLGVTLSVGAAEYDPARDVSAKTLLDRADKALYQSKQEGRNRTTLSP
ncbi:MAG: GGDEF domain-containing protein [Treponema sp.]|nr:GGDEF domain-containing protein [Treponema sp.]